MRAHQLQARQKARLGAPVNSIICVAGMRGHGKSTFVRNALSGVKRILICDALGEHQSIAPAYSGTLAEQLKAFSKETERDTFSRSFLLPADREQQDLAFHLLCRMAYICAARDGRIAFAIEEVDYFSRSNAENPGLNIIIQYGRHAPVDVIYTTRSLVSISRRLTSETDAWILFRQQEPRWLDALADRVGQDVAQAVEQLERFQYVQVDNNGEWRVRSL